MNRDDVNRDDVVAVAVDPMLTRRQATAASREAAELLADAGVPFAQRTWIVASGADEVRSARIAAAIADAVGSSRLVFHDPSEPDDLIFQRRYPGRRRGGVYLNAVWQSASARIVVGDADTVARGLCAWFNPPESVSADDLNADIVLGG